MSQASVAPKHVRADLQRIASWIEPESRVLDLGCGDGTLLAYLQNNKNVTGAGVELSDELVIASVRRGVQVIQQNLEEGLALFDDQQFDISSKMAEINVPAWPM
ncbi:MAG: methionine biosynthesis protein MetW, partial [Pollutimonas bauzanensis]